ncbi:MAG: hypothetical protein IPM21_08765 [Acidobacteria bacterium]|nr:hypothetical protein [Acidobacteriota bacterium]
MISTTKKHIRRNWQIFPNDDRLGRWCKLYATLNRDGDIMISRFTHEALGSPECVLLLFDSDERVIGLKPARETQKDAFPVRPRGSYGGRRIRAYRFCQRHAIKIDGTVRFPRLEIDAEGILILDTKDIEYFKIRRRPKPRPSRSDPVNRAVG